MTKKDDVASLAYSGVLTQSSGSFYDESEKRNWSLETFGLCGAGKTTLLRRLFVKLQEIGGNRLPSIEMPVQPDREAVLFETGRIVTRSFLHAPREVYQFLREANAWWLPSKLGFRVAGIKMRRTMSAPLLIDSGLLQPFVSFAIERNIEDRHIPREALLDSVVLPTLAVYVHVAPENAYFRYIDREIGSGRELPHGDLRKRFDDAYEICQWVRERYENSQKILHVVDTSGDISDEQLENLARSILEDLWRIEGRTVKEAA